MRIRATHLQVAQHCTGSPEMQRRTDQRPLVDDAVRLGTIGHAYLEIALSVGWGAAAAWLAGVPEVEEQLPELLSPDLQVWIEQEVLEGKRGEAEVPALWNTGLGAAISMRLDWAGSRFANPLVVDWKFGRGQEYFLEPIHEDLQMIAYGVLAYGAQGMEGREARVKRVQIDERKMAELVLGEEAYLLARAWLHDIVADVVRQPETRTPGLWCNQCWARHACPERLDLIAPVSVALALPGTTLSLSHQEASQWAVARDALRDRMDALDAALKGYVADGGQVLDRERGRHLAIVRYKRDRLEVTGPDLLAELATVSGAAGADALTSSKARVMAAMEAAGLDRAARGRVWEDWKRRGLVSSEEEVSLKWHRDRRVIG